MVKISLQSYLKGLSCGFNDIGSSRRQGDEDIIISCRHLGCTDTVKGIYHTWCSRWNIAYFYTIGSCLNFDLLYRIRRLNPCIISKCNNISKTRPGTSCLVTVYSCFRYMQSGIFNIISSEVVRIRFRYNSCIAINIGKPLASLKSWND